MPSKPPRDWGNRGAPTGGIRLRPSWFGFAIMEEQVAFADGTVKWLPLSSFCEPIPLSEPDLRPQHLTPAMLDKLEAAMQEEPST